MASWQIRGRTLRLDRTLVMGILNVTPDSFSDGGHFLSVDDALRRAERMIDEGVHIIDVGGESTRPKSQRVDVEEERRRVVPVVKAIAKHFDFPISIDTTRSEVAEACIDAGAHLINDISGLRFDACIATVAASRGAGLVLMHSRGEFDTMHSQSPVPDIFAEVIDGFRRSIEKARAAGITDNQLVLDPGIGFGKSVEQNLELLAGLDKLKSQFSEFPFLVGASRKSFIGKTMKDSGPEERLSGSVAAAVIASWNGADIVRVHDVKPTVEALAVTNALRERL